MKKIMKCDFTEIAFRSKNLDVRGTGFGSANRISTKYKNAKNSKSAVLTRPIGEALVTVSKGTGIESVLKSENLVYVKYTGDNKNYEAVVNLQSKIVNIAWNLAENILNESYVTRGLIVPIVIADILEGKTPKLKEYLDNLSLLDLYDTNNEKLQENMFLAHDSFYYSYKGTKFDYLEEQTISKKSYEKCTEDVTSLFVKNHSNQNTTSNKSNNNVAITIGTMNGFTEEQLKNVPNLPSYYKLDEEYYDTAASMVLGDTVSAILFGPAGTGKSTSCKLICQEIKLPLIDVLSFTGNVDELILGKFVPNTEGSSDDAITSELNLVKEKSSNVFKEMIEVAMTKFKKAEEPIRDAKIKELQEQYAELTNKENELVSKITSDTNSGKYSFIKPPIIEAIENGGCVVIEEINMAKPQYIAFLNSLLDDNAFVTLDNGETIRRHPNFRLFGTMNPEYSGTSEINLSLWDRFDEKILVQDLGKDTILSNLLNKVKIDRKVAEGMIKVYDALKEKIKQEDAETVLSIRGLENWAKKYNVLKDARKAAKKTIVSAITQGDALDETEVLQIIDTVFSVKSFRR